jgi:hypothetical protein
LNCILIVCEIIGQPKFGVEITGKVGSLLPQPDEVILDPKATATTYEPISDFGEKRILPITNKTVVIINKLV